MLSGLNYHLEMWEPQRNICWIIHRLTIELWLPKFQYIYIYRESIPCCIGVWVLAIHLCILQMSREILCKYGNVFATAKGQWVVGSGERGVTGRWQCLMGCATWCQKVQCTHPANCFICIIYAHSMQSQFNLRWRSLPTANAVAGGGSQVVRRWCAIIVTTRADA